MRLMLTGLMLLAVSGCVDFNEALNSERKPVNPPGIASTDDVDAVGRAASGQNADERQNAAPAQQPQQPAAAQTSAAPPAGNAQNSGRNTHAGDQGKASFVGRTTRDIVDVREATKNPNIVVITPKTGGSDPLTQVGSTYVRGASFAGSLPLKQMIQHHKALEGRAPSYPELMTWMKQNPKVELPVLSPAQMYGYDSQTGEIVVLEDKAEKARRYREAGIPVE
jgi:hypothetical protein